MSLTDRAYEVVAEVFEHHEDELMSRLQEKWPATYGEAIAAQQEEDPDFDDEDVPEFSIFCEQVAPDDEEAFLEGLKEIVDTLFE